VEREKLTILKMIEEGRVTAEEGLRLLEVLEGPERPSPPREPRRLRLTVTELGTGRRRVQLNVPVSLVDLGLRVAARSANRFMRVGGHQIDLEAVAAAIREGGVGRILDLTDEVENVRVEVFLE